MWQCPTCKESVEDTFEICWNCGTARDGTIDPSFMRESESAAHVPEADPRETNSASVPGTGGGMNRREIAALACKTLALLLFAQAAFISISSIVLILFAILAAPFRGWLNWDEISTLLILSIPVLATLIVGLLYWKHSRAIASRMVSGSPEPVTALSITVQDITIVAFNTAGVFILVEGVREFVATVFRMHQFNSTVADLWSHPQTWTALVQLAFGLWLVLGSQGIVRAVRWLRTAGVSKPEDEPNRESLAPHQ